MKLHHIAFWTKDIENLISFYEKHFQGKLLFTHEDGDFKCTFIKICKSITIEIMTRTDIADSDLRKRIGYSHLSIEMNSKDEVDKMTKYFISENVPFEKMNEQYDDGFYESAIIDPDGNIIEMAYIDRNVNNAL